MPRSRLTGSLNVIGAAGPALTPGEDYRVRSWDCSAAGRTKEAERWLARSLAADRETLKRDGPQFQPLVRLGRFREAFELGERILASGDDVRGERIFWNPWVRIRRESFPRYWGARRSALIEMLSRRSHVPWALFFLAAIEGGTRQAELLENLRKYREPRYGWMGLQAGRACLVAERLKSAEFFLRWSLAGQPREWRAYGYLAEMRVLQGQNDKAWALFDRALKAAPSERPSILAWRGEVALWIGRYRQALRDLEVPYRKGLDLARCWRGAAQLLLGDARSALDSLEEAVKTCPYDSEAFVWRAEALYRLGRYEGALKSLDREPLGFWARILRTLCRVEIGSDEDLRRELDGLRRCQSPSAFAYRMAGLSDERLSRDKVRALFKWALRKAKGFRRDDYQQRVWLPR